LRDGRAWQSDQHGWRNLASGWDLLELDRARKLLWTTKMSQSTTAKSLPCIKKLLEQADKVKFDRYYSVKEVKGSDSRSLANPYC
jgi:hypothetical protein